MSYSRKKRKRIFQRIKSVLIPVLIGLFAFGWGYSVGVSEKKADSVTVVSNTESDDAKPEKPKHQIPEDGSDIVDSVMKDMTLSDMVYQMMFVTPEAVTDVGLVTMAGDTTKAMLEERPVGGIIYFAQNFENREQTIEMISNTQSYSRIPLFISVDEEGGIVSRLGSNSAMGVTNHPPMREIGDSLDYDRAYEVGVTLGKELSELGFNVDFAPDADVLINAANSEIGNRSFGDEPEVVGGMVENVVRGMQENGVSATLKHFPGHGSTSNNSHYQTSVSTRSFDEIKSAEFVPFVKGIEAGADFIMISHMTLTNAVQEQVPCSVSKEVVTGWLIDELGYQGIIITDAFNMGAVSNMYSSSESAIKAIEAGADMILMTPDLVTAHNAVVEAVESGKIPQERIEYSVRKILTLKKEKGMFE